MKSLFDKFLIAASAACIGAAALSPAASADPPSFGISRLTGLAILADGHPGIDRVLDDPQFFRRIDPCRNWAQVQPKLDHIIEQNLPQVNPKLPKGVSIHHQSSRLSNTCNAVYSISGRYIVLTVTIPRSVLFFKTTTPTVFGSYADPAFSLDYDLTATITVEIPSTTAHGLDIRPVHVSLSNLHFDSQNLTGDLVKVADAVSKFLGGPDFLAPITQSRSFDFDGFKAGISQINARLASLRGRNLPVLRFDYDPQHQKLTLRVTNPATVHSDTCSMGYVWREATANDHVCVMPQERDVARRQNAEASKHKQANGDLCLPGYVWREATAGDHVCVTPAERQRARVQNSQGASHREASQEPVIH